MKSSLKILVVPGWYPSKFNPYNGDFVQEQARGIRKSGVDISVIYANLDYRYGVVGFVKKRTFKVEDNVPVFRLDGFGWPKKNKWALDRWTKSFMTLYGDYVAQNGKPDILHAHSFWGGYVAMQLSQKHGVPYVYTEHFTGILQDNIPTWQLDLYAKVYSRARKVISVSHELSRKIKSKFGIDCVVLPNFIDTQLFALKKMSNQKPRRFIGVGDLVARKRFDLSIKAINLLRRDGCDVELVIVGSGEKEVELKQLAHRLGCEQNIIFKGRLTFTQVAAELQAADIFLLSSDVETFGIVLVEAMSCGLPVVATDCYGSRDIVTKETGILVSRNDANRLAEAMSLMITGYAEYSTKKIRNYANQNFGFDSVIQRLKTLYQDVINE